MKNWLMCSLQRFPKKLNRFLGNIAAGKPSSPLQIKGRIAFLPLIIPIAIRYSRPIMTGIAIISTVLCLQMTACSPLSPVKTSPINLYTLNVKNNIPAISQRRAQVLLIAAPTAAPGYQSANIIYTLRPYELKSFTRNRWAAPPAEMLAPLLSQNLQASGCFHAVVTPPFTGDVDLILDTRLLNLQQEFLGTTSQVHVVLQLTLSNNKTQQVIANQRVETVVPVAENNPYAGVIATNTAIDMVLNKVRKVVCIIPHKKFVQ